MSARSLHCPVCGSSRFHTSRLRLTDLGHLVCMQYPLRCRRCHHRHFWSLRQALLVQRRNKLQD